MTPDEIRTLFKYDRWANNRTFDAAATLSAEQFTRDLGGSLRSVRDTLVHIIASQAAWLFYWQLPSPTFETLNNMWLPDSPLFHLSGYPDFAAVRNKWTEIEKDQIEFVNRVTDEMLARTFPVLETQVSLAHLMQHLANHSTYHRGQIALMMRQLGAVPLATDFAEFVMAGGAKSA